jgi:acyl dehydratase
MRTFATLAELSACQGQDVATSDWVVLSPQRVGAFADATSDHQWIHVDAARASEGPFGVPIAHGFLTLSLLPHFLDTALRVDGLRMALNYGLNKVRFTAPVPVNSRVRAHFHVQEVQALAPDGVQVCWTVTMELEGADKPACVAQALVRYYV